jgi:hypothetical protein
VEIDFYGDAPALRNEFKVWLTSDFLEESAHVDASGSKAVRELSEQVNSDDLLVVCRASDVRPVANTGYQLLSDEAVESIGREDYVRMVACMGKRTTDKYFREKRSGLTCNRFHE